MISAMKFEEKKINAHLLEDGVTKASLCRTLGKMTPAGTLISEKSMNDFLKKKGHRIGIIICMADARPYTDKYGRIFTM